jgi:thiol:disulfide interchange protein DsbD
MASALLVFLLHGPALAQLREVGNGSAGPVKAAHVTAELLSSAPAITLGGATKVALILELEPGWHVYWVDAGDSGEPPSVDWVLPSGITVGPMEFPAPKRLPLGPLMDYGYEGIAVFPFDLQAAPSAHGSHAIAHVAAHARWLVCREVCLPGKAFLGLTLPLKADSHSAGQGGLIAAAIAKEPVPLPSNISVLVSGTRDHLMLTVETGKNETTAEFFPFDEYAVRNAAEQKLVSTRTGVRLNLERGDISDALPARLKGVLELSGGRAYTIDSPVQATTAAAVQADSLGPGFPLAILLAFAGGLVLNLMPCVFPVLFLKALALIETAGDGRRSQKLYGFLYTGGVLVSFWIIVATLLILRAGGRQAGWGFQLQSPPFVVVMASLLFFMALSLAGQFDIGLTLTSKGDALTRKHGYLSSFFTGMLATVVATPCTAPLMGAAVGFALSQSATAAFAVFTSLAFGLALPYLLLTLHPSWAKLMPRPGRWMELLKQFTALPLLLTVIWLVWVYGHLYSSGPGESVDHMARLLVGLLLLATAGWALARWPAQRLGMFAALGSICASLTMSLSAPDTDSLQWKPFSQTALEQARAEGRPVFVDFTAAWCLSCQVNERAVLHDKAVEHEFKARHYVLLRADWTRYDPNITQRLASIGRSGVPTYVIYPANSEFRTQVLPELLSRAVVLDALAGPRT